MDYINLIFKDFDFSFLRTVALIAPISIILILIDFIGILVDAHKRTLLKVCIIGTLTVGIVSVVGSIGYTFFVQAQQVQYEAEAQTYLSDTLKESYGLTIAEDDTKKLAYDIYNFVISNDSIIESGRTVHDPIMVTTDDGTLITIIPIQDGDKLSIYKSTNDDMVLMEKKKK